MLVLMQWGSPADSGKSIWPTPQIDCREIFCSATVIRYMYHYDIWLNHEILFDLGVFNNFSTLVRYLNIPPNNLQTVLVLVTKL